MTLSTLDLVIIGVYAVAIFGLAHWVAREKHGRKKNSNDYFLASRSLPWWAIGTSLIAANISAEQIIGMSGSGYALGLAIASYEWMAAATLLIVGKWILPIFLHNRIVTMPQFLEQRYGTGIRNLMTVFWLALYVFVNLTSIAWLGSIAVNQIAGIDQGTALYLLAAFALLYQLYGGLKAVALTDIVQVALLVLGGLLVSGLTLDKIGDGAGIGAGFRVLVERAPDHFHMILKPDNPFYRDLPGLSVLIGGMWLANLSYWGFNQYIIQRALAARDLDQAQKGVIFAAFLKLLMPIIIVLPGIAAVVLAPDLSKPDEAYPTMMRLLPPGVLGLVFSALIAAVISSMASKINSIATIFTLDLFDKYAAGARRGSDSDDDPVRQRRLVRVGRIVATVAVVIAAMTARPLLGKSDQAFQFIQEFTGFFTPGITVIFLLGLFWKRANEAGAIAAATGSVAFSYLFKMVWPSLPFLDRMSLVFLVTGLLAMAVSLLVPSRAGVNRIEVEGVSFRTSAGFNIAALAVVAILVALYATWW
ncbi:sodium:solute symporter family transporter [Lysobacter antibioticus]|uniref:sodium:solute symporter family transporter n=1 Tax=Lysobacter antibioticus TaxID=84531 RepID=UPI0004D01C49|nr:sodium/solute symporter [Lysobacter antibioticus]